MDVDIYLFRGHLQQHKRHGIAVHGQQGVISLDDGISDPHVFDPATVNKQGDVPPVGTMHSGRADVALHAEHLVGGELRRNLQQTAAEFRPVDLLQRLALCAVAGGAQRLLPIVDHGERHARIRDGIAGEEAINVATFGAGRLQEFPPRGHVVEQRLDAHVGAVWSPDCPLPAHLPAIHAQPRAGNLCDMPGGASELAH